MKDIKFLVRYRDSEGKLHSQIYSAGETALFYEYRDLYDVQSYDIKLIDSKTFALHKVIFWSTLTNYETGAHVLFIVKGTSIKFRAEPKDSDERKIPEKYIYSYSFSHDH
jgi:hypothetical protein